MNYIGLLALWWMLFISLSTLTKMEAAKQVIVVSVPEDKYYKKHLDDICQFVRDLAEAAGDYDEVVALFPRKFASKLQAKEAGKASATSGSCNLGKASIILVDESIDLWMRDFGLGLPGNPVKFIYGPTYLSRSDARFVDNSFRRWLSTLKVAGLPESIDNDLILDGGNVVDNAKDKAVVSDRFFYENKRIREAELERKLERSLGMKVAIIPDPEDTTGHADGVVSFIDTNVLLIADYCDAEYYKMVDDSVKEAFPDLKIIKLPCREDKKTKSGKKDSKWRGFSSAVGAYVNILLTNSTVYVPVFGDAIRDQEILSIVRSNTSRRVTSVDTSKLSHMGGSVRCMTWQIDASHEIGKALLKAAAKPNA